MKREALEEMRRDASSPERSAAFAASRAAEERWRREHPTSLAGVLEWIESLREAFGDPPVDRTPWRGSDFRL